VTKVPGRTVCIHLARNILPAFPVHALCPDQAVDVRQAALFLGDAEPVVAGLAVEAVGVRGAWSWRYASGVFAAEALLAVAVNSARMSKVVLAKYHS